jgi:hypothetical protein
MSSRIITWRNDRAVNELALLGALVVGLGFLAAVVASLGSKGILVAGGATAVAAGFLAVRDRVLLVIFLMVAGGLQFMLHKSFGPIDTTISSGAEAVYVTSLYGRGRWSGT